MLGRGLQRLRLVGVQRLDSGRREAVAQRRVQVVGHRHGVGRAGRLARLGDEALVGPALLEKGVPGLDFTYDGHAEPW